MNVRAISVRDAAATVAGIVFFASLAGDLAGADPVGSLYFRNGDRLAGSLDGIDFAGGSLDWRSSGGKASNRFDLRAVAYAVTDASPGLLFSNEERLFQVRLTNGDSVPARLEKLDDTVLEMTVAGLGRLRIPREAVERGLVLPRVGDLFASGPDEGKHWSNHVRRDHWDLKDGALYSRGSSIVGAKVLPEGPCRLSFEVSYLDGSFLNIQLGARSAGGRSDDYYQLQLSDRAISCYRYRLRRPRPFTDLEVLVQPGPAQLERLKAAHQHIRIDLDRQSGIVSVAIDEEPFAKFRDPTGSYPSGRYLAFSTHGNNKVRVRNIQIYRWNAERIEACNATLQEDSVIDIDGRLTPKLSRFNGKIFFADEKPIALDRVAGFRLGSRATGGAKSRDAVTVYLEPLGQLQLQPRSFSGSALGGEHVLLGELSIGLEAIEAIAFGQATSSPPDEASGQGLLELKDGGRLRGWPISWAGSDSAALEWKCPQAIGPVAVPIGRIQSIQFPPPAQNVPPIEAEVSVYRAGNVVPGKVESFDAEFLTLKTSFSAPLRIPREFVQEIRFLRQSTSHYRGPGTVAEGWRFTEPDRWTLTGGVLRGRGVGGAGREISLPDRGRLDVRMKVTSGLDVSVGLFCRELGKPVSPNGYQLKLGENTLALFRGLTAEEVAAVSGPAKDREDRREALRNLRVDEQLARFNASYGGSPARKIGGPVPMAFQSGWQEHVLSVCWDAAENSIAVIVDGNLIHEWIDEQGLPERVGGLVFFKHNAGGTLEVRQIEVQSWNGILPDSNTGTDHNSESIGNVEADKQEGQALIHLVNQDILRGEVLSIADSGVRLRSDLLGELVAPLERFAYLRFPENKSSVAVKKGLVLRGNYHVSGECLFLLRSIKDGHFHLESPFFGEHAFRFEAFQKLDFDLQDHAFWSDPERRWEEPPPPRLRRF